MVLEAAHRYQTNGPTEKDDHKTIFDGLVNKFVQESDDGTLHIDRLPVRLLSDQAFMLLLAGTETTATTMVFLLHLLSENPHEEFRLLHELQQLGDIRDPKYDFRAASNLPIVVC
jgi:cytochrome P450